MSRVELTSAPAPAATSFTLEFCSVPIGTHGLCPIVAGATVTPSPSGSTRMCPTHAYIAADCEDAEVVWDAPQTQPLAVAYYEQHRHHLDGLVGNVDGKSGGAL